MQAMSFSHQIAAVVAESTAFLGIPAVGAGAAAARSGPARGLRAAQSALPGQTQVPQCLRQAAEKGSLSLSTLYQAVNTLEKSGSVSVAQVDSLLQRVQGQLLLARSHGHAAGSRMAPKNRSGNGVSGNSRFQQQQQQQQQQQMRSYSSFRFINHRKLQKLETEAIANPNNPAAQAEFYKELLRIDDYGGIISRFESGKFANSEASLQYYAIALARTNQAEQIVPKILQRLQRQPIATETEALINNIGQGVRRQNTLGLADGAITNNGAALAESLAASTGNKGNPIYVVMDESKNSKGYMLWRGLRWLGITVTYAFCILTFLSLVFENSGLLKPPPAQTEFEPSVDNNVKFSDVQGVDESKQELEEVVEFLKDPNKYNQLGGKLPKGVLLTGPPGTGKTMLARAVAGEAGVPFFFMSGSEFDEMYVGVGARRVRELFAAARSRAPSIVFIDELDAIGARRNPKDQTYMKQTLNQLLVELDGFSQTEGVIIIAATNFPELLDKALVRPGRFDRHVNVPLPDVRGRMQILKHHLKNISTSPNVDISVIARGTPGFSGADLANLINQAAIQASREGVSEVGIKQFEHAKDKILMGVERRSQVVTMESKKLTAYHEGGHALVALYTPGAMPLHKATIMPRGNALGVTVQLPDMDKDSFTRKEYLAQLDVAMGGRVAEEMIFGAENVTSGCSSDIVQATRVAKMMVTQFGMSDKVGPVAHNEEDMAALSTPTKLMIESETKSLIESAQARVTLLLKTHKEELHRLAKALVDYETLTQEEIRRAIEGKPIVR
ncbi:ATP-dependent metalloprotease [Entomortierella parvispora]|uniref:ATP-dependent metalloprotease n=1 Tax=Entomortierella parvispora TaxID=205924 RepID=A0A9P3HBJ1_9FUNG|nr:ATP-dependent metalloprotease [Entomortierella parvispora]